MCESWDALWQLGRGSDVFESGGCGFETSDGRLVRHVAFARPRFGIRYSRWDAVDHTVL